MMESGKENVPVGIGQLMSQSCLSLETIPPKKRAMYKRKLLHGIETVVAGVHIIESSQTSNSKTSNNDDPKNHKYMKIGKEVDDNVLKTTETLVLQPICSTITDVTTKEPSPVRTTDPLDHQTPEQSPHQAIRYLNKDISKPLFPSCDDTKNPTCTENEKSENQKTESVSNSAGSECNKGIDSRYSLGLEPIKQNRHPNLQPNPDNLLIQPETQPRYYNALTCGLMVDNSSTDNIHAKSMRIPLVLDFSTAQISNRQNDKGDLEYGESRHSLDNSLSEVVEKNAETDNEAENVKLKNSLEAIKNIQERICRRILPAENQIENNGLARLENSIRMKNVKEYRLTCNSSDEWIGNEQGFRNQKCEGRKKFCWICNMSFTATEKLVHHMNFVHQGQKPYKCQHCEREFGQYNNLRRHLRVHREKEFKCKLCDRKFNEEFYLKMHMSTHTGQRVYTCGVCNDNFPTSQELKAHVSTHSPSKLHTCNVCGKSFSKACVLRQHRKGHSGERPHKCELCLKTFIHRHHLTMHLRSHKEQKLYSCDVCKKNFAQSSHLNKHMKSHEDPNHSEKFLDVSQPLRPDITLNISGKRSRVKASRNPTNVGCQNDEKNVTYNLSCNGSWLINKPQKDISDKSNYMSKLHFSGGKIDEMKTEKNNRTRPENKMYERKNSSKTTANQLATTLSPSFRKSLAFSSIPCSSVPQITPSSESAHQRKVTHSPTEVSHGAKIPHRPEMSYSTKVTELPNSTMSNNPSRVSLVPIVSYGSAMSHPEVSNGSIVSHPELSNGLSVSNYSSSLSHGSLISHPEVSNGSSVLNYSSSLSHGALMSHPDMSNELRVSNNSSRVSHGLVMSHPAMPYGSQMSHAAVMPHQTMAAYFYPYHYPNMNRILPPFRNLYPSHDYYRAYLQQNHNSYMVDYMSRNPAIHSYGYPGHAVNSHGYVASKEQQEYQDVKNKEKSQRVVTDKGQRDPGIDISKELDKKSKAEEHRVVYSNGAKEQECEDQRSKTGGQRFVYTPVDKEQAHDGSQDKCQTDFYTNDQTEEDQRVVDNQLAKEHSAKEQAYQEQRTYQDKEQRMDTGYSIDLSSFENVSNDELVDIPKNSSSENTVESDVDLISSVNVNQDLIANKEEKDEIEADEQGTNDDSEHVELDTKGEMMVTESDDGSMLKLAKNLESDDMNEFSETKMVESKDESNVTVDDNIPESLNINQTSVDDKKANNSENTVMEEMHEQRANDEVERDRVEKGSKECDGGIRDQQNEGSEMVVNVCHLVVGKNGIGEAAVESEIPEETLNNCNVIGDVEIENETKEIKYEDKSEAVKRSDDLSRSLDAGLLDRESLNQMYKHAIEASSKEDQKNKENSPEVFEKDHSRNRARVNNFWTMRPVLGNIQTESNIYRSDEQVLNRAENSAKTDSENFKIVLSNTQGESSQLSTQSENLMKTDYSNSLTGVQYGFSGQHGMDVNATEGVLDLSSKIQ